jgi:NMD protein affecting ribosome stability and mRNA decay
MRTTLRESNLCPKCGANRDVIKEMLADEYNTHNYWTAYWTVQNCSACKEYFQHKEVPKED